MHKDDYKLLENVNSRIQKDDYTDISSFVIDLNKFYESICIKLEKFLLIKKQVMIKMKKCILQKSLDSILQDQDRLLEKERDEFMEAHHEMIE
jgi:hypothetical protein